MRTALITGITGQDGAYLARLLLREGYRVVGLIRRSSVPTSERLEGLRFLDINDKVVLADGDVTDLSSLCRIVAQHQPDEVYNLASQSFVGASWDQPILTANATGTGALNMLEAVRLIHPAARFYQASSSEMFGTSNGAQNEQTPLLPQSPYGAAKVFAHDMTKIYRDSFGMHASSGILFNHESPIRGRQFVTRKITDGVARIKVGLQQKIKLGNITAHRDWGHAEDYVRAMWLMLQQDEPGDYVVATGLAITVGSFCEIAFSIVGLDLAKHLEFDKTMIRPNDVNILCGDASKARNKLGWEPNWKVEELIRDMVNADLVRYGVEGKLVRRKTA